MVAYLKIKMAAHAVAAFRCHFGIWYGCYGPEPIQQSAGRTTITADTIFLSTSVTVGFIHSHNIPVDKARIPGSSWIIIISNSHYHCRYINRNWCADSQTVDAADLEYDCEMQTYLPSRASSL